MDKFFKRKSIAGDSSQSHARDKSAMKQSRVEIDLTNLPADPGHRLPIWSYNANDRDQVRRAYLLKGPTQPESHDFPQTEFVDVLRRFKAEWFKEYNGWLEYSVAKDAAYCLYCYLFRPQTLKGGGDSFVGEGFINWKKKMKLKEHVGKHNSAHNQAKMKCQNLMNQNLTGRIDAMFTGKSNQDKIDYRVRLIAAVDYVRFLLRQGLAFRGNDESEWSMNRGNYLELFHWLAAHNEDINKVSLKNAPSNSQLVSSDIQKDICIAAATEVTNAIIRDIGNATFTILIDESRDVSTKEQMAISLRYVDKKGDIIERFIGVVHVANTTSAVLKDATEQMFALHKLSLSSLRGQGYDGASNMQGKYKGLKALILEENPCAFYVHCFAHQLQLALVDVPKNHFQVKFIFEITLKIMNIVGASCKRQEILRAKQHDKVIEALKKGEIISGRGLNQEINLQRPGDIRWSSHYNTLLSLISMFSSVVEVLEVIMVDGVSSEQTVEACMLLEAIQTFDFVFTMHLMKSTLAITNELSLALQKKEQEIENAMRLV
ncbi:zinc finger MYM-type protein 1-like isoform X2 [Tripterygium wilfordii]|nr:zinc finger MYM-type protein 1-like isoform X2 [Tripterygium wilfordii]XP_038679227.1 zinc finger MYM-type protein 1-like isoform X2 [Tripterygium wilfordii]